MTTVDHMKEIGSHTPLAARPAQQWIGYLLPEDIETALSDYRKLDRMEIIAIAWLVERLCVVGVWPDHFLNSTKQKSRDAMKYILEDPDRREQVGGNPNMIRWLESVQKSLKG